MNGLILRFHFRFHLQKYSERHKITELLIGGNTDGISLKKVRI